MQIGDSRTGDWGLRIYELTAEEADESKGWLELLVTSNHVTGDDARGLLQEANELIAIFVASRKTAQRHKEERERLQRESRGRNRRRRSG